MPRANRRRREERGLDPALVTRQTRETHAGVPWIVRRVTGRDPDRRYRCPGCQQMFVGTLAHVLAWPEHGGIDERRHWHGSCWRARHSRPAAGLH
ncbi:MAG: hypothetical protein Q4G43_11480 [Mobilicoccus sp.]|nr:hypothetical protein [Mobilicoccus sp.]